jgi:tetratricopeptide (TPR) repeat protein
MRYSWMVFSLLALAGCTTVSVTKPVEVMPEPQPTDLQITIPEVLSDPDKGKMILPGPHTSPAVVSLLEQARTATQQGDVQRAEVLLERTVRIDPKNAILWNYLAKIRLQQGRFNEAAGLAQKSNVLAKGDKKLQIDNWRIIAHARHRNGDLAGSREAQIKIDALQE